MHWLALPEPHKDTAPAFQNVAEATDWLSTQPQVQPLHMLVALGQQVQAIDAATLTPPALTIELLDVMRLAAIPQHENIAPRFTRKALPMQPEDQRSFEISQKFWTSLAIAYLRCVPQCPPAEQAVALHRAANALRVAQYSHFQAAHECPELLERLAFITLAEAETRGAMLLPLPDAGYPQMGESNCAGHLAWIFMLRLIDPYRLSATQLAVANRALSRWREMASFHVAPDPDTRGPAIDLGQRLDRPLPEGLPHWLNVRSLLRKMRVRVEALEAGETPESLKLGRELSGAACIRLLKAMAEGLRAQNRQMSTGVGEIQLSFGSENAYALLKDETLNDSALDERGSSLSHRRVAMFGFDRVSQLPTAVKRQNVPHESWNLVDGKAMRPADREGERHLAPCLVATRQKEKPRLGIMLSLQTGAAGVLVATLSWFDEEIEAGWIKPALLSGNRGARQPAFLLVRANSMSILLPATSGVRLDMPLALEGLSAQKVIPTEVLMRGVDFVRYACHAV